jgi:hypothetical protein
VVFYVIYLVAFAFLSIKKMIYLPALPAIFEKIKILLLYVLSDDNELKKERSGYGCFVTLKTVLVEKVSG